MITRKEFSEQVERLIVRGRGADIMSAIVKVCELNNVEPESAKRLLSTPLKEKLEAEAAGEHRGHEHTHTCRATMSHCSTIHSACSCRSI